MGGNLKRTLLQSKNQDDFPMEIYSIYSHMMHKVLFNKAHK